MRSTLPATGALLCAAFIACSSELVVSRGASDGGAGDGGGSTTEGGASSEAGADGGSGDGGDGGSLSCKPPCAAMPTKVPTLAEVTGIVATSTGVVVGSSSGLTWCTNAACTSSMASPLSGAGVIGIAIVLPAETVFAVSAGSRLFACPAGLPSCTERYVSANFAGLTAFAATPNRVFWVNPNGTVLSAPSAVAVTPAVQTWAMPNVGDVEVAAGPNETVLVSNPGANYVSHVLAASTANSIATTRDVSSPRGLVLSAGLLYIASRGNGTIVRCPLSGCAVNDASVGDVMATNQSAPLYLATDATHVYWTNEGTGAPGSGSVGRAPLGGGAVEVFITGLTAPRYIAVNSTAVFVTVGPLGGLNDVVYALK